MREFRKVQKKELPKLSALWQLCFGDSTEEVNLFWETLFDEISVFAAWEQAQPVAMLCALPVSLVDEVGEALPAAYFYAVCTHPDYRRQGLCAKLMAYSEETLKKEGISLFCLVPAEKELFPLYEKMGYRNALYHRAYDIPAQKGKGKITKTNAESYQNLRQMQLYGSFADYSLPLLSWQQRLSEKSGAGLYRIELPEGIFCAVAEKHGTTLHIKELLPDCPEAAALLASHLGAQSARVRTEGENTAFGMAKALCGENIPEFSYFALAFD